MTIFGVDISKYQQPSAMDGYDFVILNVEDPTLGAKIDYAYANNKRWDIYKWCYPGASGQDLFATALARVNASHRAGTRRPQFWLDYEEAGVQTWQIDQWYTACDQAGETTGLYIYLYLMNNQGVTFTRDGWLAYYPSASGDYWPSMSDEARARGAKLHQYTSTGGTIDKNVVLDEAWYGTAPVPPTPEPPLPDLSFLFRDEEDPVFAWSEDPPGDLSFYSAGMLYELTPYTVRALPGQAAKDIPGSLKVTGPTLTQMIVARWTVAKALNVPIA